MLKIRDIFIDGGRVRTGGSPDPYRYAMTDRPDPVFSWAAESSRAQNGQTACRVTVERGDGSCLWDSGWIDRAEQSLTYGGPDLPRGVVLSLTVTIRDRFGEESAPKSVPLVSALLDGEEIRGGWIGSGEATDGRVLYFRKDFSLTDKPDSASPPPPPRTGRSCRCAEALPQRDAR